MFLGRLSFPQCITGKRARYGIKLFEQTKPEGYDLYIEIYEGKADILCIQKKRDLVLHLIGPHLHKKYHLFMDSFHYYRVVKRITYA